MPSLKKKETCWNKYKTFSTEQSRIFKIIAAPQNINQQEKYWGVKMTNNNKSFCEIQKLVCPMECCEAFVERKLELSRKRTLAIQNKSRNETFDKVLVL